MGSFYHRKEELHILQESFDKLNGPKIISVAGVSGVGKTRLIQEFYNQIAKKSGYWKVVSAELGKKLVEVVPAYKGDEPDLDWLFFSARSSESKCDKYDFAFDKIRHQYSYHLPQILKTLRNKARNKKLLKSSLGVLLNFAVPGSGGFFNAINFVRESIGNALDVHQLLCDIEEKVQKTTNSRDAFYESETVNLIQSTQNVFEELFSLRHNLRVVIYLEDFQWVDAYTCSIITALFERAQKQNWNLLFVVSHWPLHLQNNTTAGTGLPAFCNWCSSLDPDQKQFVSLGYLDDQSLAKIVQERLQGIQPEVAQLLAGKSRGDIDLLNDFIDEIAGSIGWVDDLGRLIVDIHALKELPSKAIEMAKSRLMSYPTGMREHLAWSSIQGPTFEFELATSLLKEYASSENYYSHLQDAEELYGIVGIIKSDIYGHTGEFKRAVVFEACFKFICKHPQLNKLKRSLVARIANLISSDAWPNITRIEKTKIIESFIYLLDDIHDAEDSIIHTKINCLVEIAQYKLLIGDYQKAIGILSPLFSTVLLDEHKNRILQLLSEAYYYSGSAEDERLTLEKWQAAIEVKSYEFELQFARFLRRQSQPDVGIKYVKEAMKKATTQAEAFNARIELVKALWANGKVYEAYKELKELDKQLNSDLKVGERVPTSFHHSSALALHDIDKNKQVLYHAGKCIEDYERSGDIQSLIISRVNYADALWGLGYGDLAQEHLKASCELCEKHDLPHAKDIVFICYANVLAASGKHSLAAKYYSEGLLLANQIGHNWDSIYCMIYEGISLLRDNRRPREGFFQDLLDRSKTAHYHYLVELAFAALCVQATLDNMAFPIDLTTHVPKLPVGKLFYLSNRILTKSASDADINQFLTALGECEGVKLFREQIFLSLRKLIADGSIADPIKADFAARWLHSYDSNIEISASVRLKTCDYRLCEARCCYDGVYLLDGEEEKISEAVQRYPAYFKHLPTEYIVDGQWGDLKGRKTSVREHVYRSPDFPAHFENTRCVFAEADGACSLQRLSIDTTDNSWTFKPKACRIHPLQTKGFEFEAPPTSVGADKNAIGISYPGYVSYTPCGINRLDGQVWVETLEDEITNFTSESD